MVSSSLVTTFLMRPVAVRRVSKDVSSLHFQKSKSLINALLHRWFSELKDI